MAYGTVKADVIQSDTTNVPPQFNGGNGVQVGTLCRAWVNFNGTGTVAIRASFNVSSITDNGTGDYTVNFTNALPDANYAATYGSQDDSGAANWVSGKYAGTYSTTAIRLQCWNYAGSARDLPIVNVSIFR
jgi:hypothetical protein